MTPLYCSAYQHRPGGTVPEFGCGNGEHLRAENLPFRNNTCHGVLCNVVVPYPDERLAIEEIGRGQAIFITHVVRK